MSDQLTIPGDALTCMFSFLEGTTGYNTAVSAICHIKDDVSNAGKEIFAGIATARGASLLASHVARGEQTAAAAMLKLNPELAQERTEVIGYTKLPAFVDTAIKHAGWARDHHMLWMIIKQIETIPNTETDRKLKLVTEMLNQLAELPERFSLEPLKDTYKKYLAEYTAACATGGSRESCDLAWLAIGMEQSKLPTNYAQYYCDPTLPLYPCPNVNQLDFKTTLRSWVLNFDNCSTGRAVPQHWYTGSGLGVNFAILRAAGQPVGVASGALLTVAHVARVDLTAIYPLHFKMRTLANLPAENYQ